LRIRAQEAIRPATPDFSKLAVGADVVMPWPMRSRAKNDMPPRCEHAVVGFGQQGEEERAPPPAMWLKQIWLARMVLPLPGGPHQVDAAAEQPAPGDLVEAGIPVTKADGGGCDLQRWMASGTFGPG